MAEHRSLESYTEREKWDSLDTPGRIRYIWDYYKLPIVIACILLYIAGYSVYRHFTHKDVFLYTALVNVAAGENLTAKLNDGFLATEQVDTSKNELRFYSDWYLTDDPASEYHEYTYATRMKVLAAIDGEQLDVVLMNQEAFDAFAQNGYLCNLEELLKQEDAELYSALQPYLITNMEVLEDNAQDVVLDPSLEYVSETTEYPMAVDLNECSPAIREAGFEASVYLGIIGNTPRTDTALEYLRYLTQA